jgi:hypothetical protein
MREDEIKDTLKGVFDKTIKNENPNVKFLSDEETKSHKRLLDYMISKGLIEKELLTDIDRDKFLNDKIYANKTSARIIKVSKVIASYKSNLKNEVIKVLKELDMNIINPEKAHRLLNTGNLEGLPEDILTDILMEIPTEGNITQEEKRIYLENSRKIANYFNEKSKIIEEWIIHTIIDMCKINEIQLLSVGEAEDKKIFLESTKEINGKKCIVDYKNIFHEVASQVTEIGNPEINEQVICQLARKRIKKLLNLEEDFDLSPHFDGREVLKKIESGMSMEESINSGNSYIRPPAKAVIKNYEEIKKSLNIKENVAIISENDRLYAYQILRNVVFDKLNNVSAEDFIEEEKIQIAKAIWRTAYEPSFNNAKVWSIDDEQIPVIFHSDVKYDENIPFPSIIINATLPIKNRIYYGIFVGSFFTEDYKYRLLISVYKEIIRKNKKETEIWGMEFFPLDSIANTDFNFINPTYYQKRLKNFVFSFCNYINEPEVTHVKFPVNPNNNKHRIQRGKLPLPEYTKTVVQGKLKIYIEKINNKITKIRNSSQFEYWVRGMYMHFRNKKRYRRLYTLNENQLEKLNYNIYNEIIRKWKKPQVRNKGKSKRQQEWEVK